MVGTFYDGHDELYHHAKFREIEQRTPAVGLKIWCFYVCYRQDTAKPQTAGIKNTYLSLHKFTSNLPPKMKKARKTKLFISIPDPIQPDLAGKGVETFHPLRGQIQLNWICDFGAPMVRFAMQILR